MWCVNCISKLSAYKCLSHRYFSADHRKIIRNEYIKQMERPRIDDWKSAALVCVGIPIWKCRPRTGFGPRNIHITVTHRAHPPQGWLEPRLVSLSRATRTRACLGPSLQEVNVIQVNWTHQPPILIFWPDVIWNISLFSHHYRYRVRIQFILIRVSLQGSYNA